MKIRFRRYSPASPFIQANHGISPPFPLTLGREFYAFGWVWMRFSNQGWGSENCCLTHLVWKLGCRRPFVWNLCARSISFHIGKEKPYLDGIKIIWGPGVISYFTGATLWFYFSLDQPCRCFSLSSSEKITSQITCCFSPSLDHFPVQINMSVMWAECVSVTLPQILNGWINGCFFEKCDYELYFKVFARTMAHSKQK